METKLITPDNGIGNIQITEGDILVGKLTFEPNQGDSVLATHTYVNPTYRGQGIAQHLVERLISYCKQEGLKIVPICSYVEALSKRNPELQELVISPSPSGRSKPHINE